MLITINTKNFKLAWQAKGTDRIAQNVFNLISLSAFNFSLSSINM